MDCLTSRPFASLTLAAVIAAAGAGAGCERNETPPNSSRSGTPQPQPSRTTTTPAADNTARNKSDTESSSKTPIDQRQNASDVTITAEIRRAIMDDKSMSVNAQNCKIITERGFVTLRGPVDSQAEKDIIGTRAMAVTGVTGIDNQLEVKSK